MGLFSVVLIADTSIRYVHFFDLMQPMFVKGMYPGKSLKKRLLSPGKPWKLVFASPGKSWKKCFNVCMNPDM